MLDESNNQFSDVKNKQKQYQFVTFPLCLMDITLYNRDKYNFITLGQQPISFPLNEGNGGWHFYKQERCRREHWSAPWFQSSPTVEMSWLSLYATQRCLCPCLKLGHTGTKSSMVFYSTCTVLSTVLKLKPIKSCQTFFPYQSRT